MAAHASQSSIVMGCSAAWQSGHLPLAGAELEGREALGRLVAKEAGHLGQHAQVVLVKGPDQAVVLAVPAREHTGAFNLASQSPGQDP